jgi:hypothetical protein
VEKDHVQISLAQVQGWTRLACYAYGGMKKSLVERKETMGESPGMHRSGNIHFKTYLPLFVVVLFGPLGNVLVGKGMKSVSALDSWAPSHYSISSGGHSLRRQFGWGSRRCLPFS